MGCLWLALIVVAAAGIAIGWELHGMWDEREKSDGVD
jgi:hypothetical protein